MQSTRRSFLGAAATASSLKATKVEASATLPQVPFGDHKISRLIIGSNQFYGFSHINQMLSRVMKEWSTPERVAQTLRRATECGINTWQAGGGGGRAYTDRELLRSQGGDIQLISLVRPDFDEQEVARERPIGIAHHGEVTDVAFREGKMASVHEYLKRARQTGVRVGVSTHNPEVVAYIEEKGWDLDFYMTCAYRRTRTEEEFRRLLGGELPLPPREIYLAEDPERMCQVVRQTRRTCLVFKILAAGRLVDSPKLLDGAFRNVLANIKPQDCVIVGMFPLYKDEMQDNAGRLRRVLAELS